MAIITTRRPGCDSRTVVSEKARPVVVTAETASNSSFSKS